MKIFRAKAGIVTDRKTERARKRRGNRVSRLAVPVVILPDKGRENIITQAV